jgi:hypothetical protein
LYKYGEVWRSTILRSKKVILYHYRHELQGPEIQRRHVSKLLGNMRDGISRRERPRTRLSTSNAIKNVDWFGSAIPKERAATQ